MRKLFLFGWLLAWLALGGNAAVLPADRAEKLELATRVHQIFEAKCADCHGSHLPKPKGKFGYVLDLARVAANDKYIQPGNVEKSELYQMVKNNEMPGEDADVPGLTAEELKTVERWVMVGAPGELPAALPPATVARLELPMGKRFIAWVGKFHPASTHFPVALLLAAVLAEAFAWGLRRPEWMLVVRFLVVVGALSSIPTATLGWLVNFPLTNQSTAALYNFHKWLGTATAVWALLCAVLLCMNECAEGTVERKRFRGALLLGALLIGVTGFLGGALVAGGLDHYKF